MQLYTCLPCLRTTLLRNLSPVVLVITTVMLTKSVEVTVKIWTSRRPINTPWLRSTAHNCTYVPPHYSSSCDHTGCGANVLDSNAKYFGPGKMIDTNKPFTLSVSFVSSGRPPTCTLSNVTNHFWQQNRTIQFDSCNPNYLQWMGKSLTGMVMTMSLWGTGDGGMSWLDGKSGCHGGCNLANSEVTFSNFQVEEL